MFQLSKKLLEDCEIYLSKKIRQKEDLSEIVEAYSIINDTKSFEEFCFAGKYVNGLIRVAAGAVNNPEVTNLEQIKKDISENLEKINSELTRISNYLSAGTRERIENKYLKLTPESFQNLKLLVEDLDDVKKYLNHLKRNN